MEKLTNITGEEIKKEIFELQNKLESLDITTYVLHPAAYTIAEKIKYYKSICPHKYSNGICIYCNSKEVAE